MGRSMSCSDTVEQKSENLTFAKCPNCRVIDLNSHDYQMEGFMYTCFMLSFYLFLTTIFMAKMICMRRDDLKDQQRLNVDMQMLKQYRAKAKKNTREFEIQSRKEGKKRMIKYLTSMQTKTGGSGRKPAAGESETSCNAANNQSLISSIKSNSKVSTSSAILLAGLNIFGGGQKRRLSKNVQLEGEKHGILPVIGILPELPELSHGTSPPPTNQEVTYYVPEAKKENNFCNRVSEDDTDVEGGLVLDVSKLDYDTDDYFSEFFV